jgi:hypothetical protein
VPALTHVPEKNSGLSINIASKMPVFLIMSPRAVENMLCIQVLFSNFQRMMGGQEKID